MFECYDGERLYAPSDYEYVNGGSFIPSDDEIEKNGETVDFLEGIVESIFKTGDLDSLMHCLEELCDIYEVPYPGTHPKIETRKNLMRSYIEYQRVHIENRKKENHDESTNSQIQGVG